jgi:hypothetical protein
MEGLKFIYSESRHTGGSHETCGTVVPTYKYADHLEMYASLKQEEEK